MELFVEQPNLDLKKGILVTKETKLEYKTETVNQELKDLILHTEVKEKGSNGINSYESKSNIKIYLIEGDILLFDENKGYYMPTYPVERIKDAISDINSLKDIKLEEE